MKIFCGGFEILESGIISSPDLSDTKFVISENPMMEIIFRVSMGEGESELSLDVLGDHTLALIFKNPKILGFGTSSPVKVGTLKGKNLYVSFHVNMRGNNNSYTMYYTFYLKEAE
jgi:hypothetical protein